MTSTQRIVFCYVFFHTSQEELEEGGEEYKVFHSRAALVSESAPVFWERRLMVLFLQELLTVAELPVKPYIKLTGTIESIAEGDSMPMVDMRNYLPALLRRCLPTALGNLPIDTQTERCDFFRLSLDISLHDNPPPPD